MGVDAGIFAEKAKKYFWFDREYNMNGFNFATDRSIMENCDKADDLWEKMNSTNKGVSSEDAIYVAEISKQCWSSEEKWDRVYWCEQVHKFIKLFPNDTFTIKSDHGDEWPECVDIYEEVTVEDLV